VVDENEADMAQLERATAMLERCLCMPDAFPSDDSEQMH